MGSLNTGNVVENVSEELWQQAAKDFSEGNKDLECLLLYCFQNGLETKACCAGHEEQFDELGNGTPYIVFEYNENSSKAIISIIKKLMNKKGIKLELDNTNDLFGKSFQINFDTLQADWNEILRACQTREKDGKINKLPSCMREIIKFIEADKDNVYATSFTYCTDDKKFNAIFSEVDLEITTYHNEKYNFAGLIDEYEQNGILQKNYLFKGISKNKIKKLIKKLSALRDKCNEVGIYKVAKGDIEKHDELRDIINGHSSLEDYQKAEREWVNRVAVDREYFDKNSMDR